MRHNSYVPPIALALALGLAAGASGRQQAAPQADDGGAVRGAFRNTRPGAKRAERKDVPQPAAAQRAKPAGAAAGGGANGAAGRKGSLAKVGKPNGAAAEVKATAPAAAGPLLAPAEAERPTGIALGYTLFMRAPTGEAVRVSNAREFRSGDSIRLLIETNTDGYLYIFNAENDGDALMIFPNAKLQRGANFVRAHVPYEIPSSAERDESLRWLSFDDRPATERVYFIVARRPLEGVPAGEALVRWCAETASEACAWSPQPGHWDALKKGANREQVTTSRAADEGRAQTPAEQEAATRGLGLAADAPLPSVIYMITSANAEILVAAVDLIHR
jgi:hypothetical protein